jgi:hypothetical protein
MVLLAGALGIEVRPGEPTGELMGRCIERAEVLSALVGGSDVSAKPAGKSAQKGSTRGKATRGGRGRGAEQVAA